MPTMKAFSMRHCARGGSALCLQRRRLCDLQMQSAAWQSGDETNYSLEPDELAAGYVLSCQALPLTSDVVVDFDAKGMA